MPCAAFFFCWAEYDDTRNKQKLTLFFIKFRDRIFGKVEPEVLGPIRSIGCLNKQQREKMGIISQFALDSDQLQGMTNRQRAFVFRGEPAQNRNSPNWEQSKIDF